MNRVCVFIDGENFRKTILELFSSQYKNHNYLPPNADWSKFIKLILTESSKSLGIESNLLLTRTYWYVINELQYSTKFLSEEFGTWSLHNRFKYLRPIAKSVIGDPNIDNNEQVGKAVDRSMKHLKTQHQKIQERLRGWKEIQSGIEQDTPKLQFQRFGHVSVDLDKLRLKSEKGVDVKLATDLVLLKDIYDIAIVVSGDADYMPALAAIKNYGKTTVSVDFLKEAGGTLPGGSRRLKHICDDSISLPYESVKSVLGYKKIK